VAGDFQRRLLKCFIKSEAYPDVKDPRNISTYNDKDKLTMSQFALALSEHLKQFPWYGPGKTPLQISERVGDICRGAERGVTPTDFKRMDGTITHRIRQVDRLVFIKAFGGYRATLHELIKKNVDNIGVLPHGTTFEQGPSHGSGCPATSVSQTLRATSVTYVAFRHTRKADGGYYSPAEAFENIGIHLGDDGLDADLPVESLEWAASRLGLTLTAGVVHHGEPGVTFLARYYSPKVWFGCIDSMCDVRRQLSKFHTTVRMPYGVRAEDKLVEKARGYVATDANTPVIGEFCRQVVSLSGDGERRRRLGLSNWWAKFDESVQFPNCNDNRWMDADFLRQFPEFDRLRFNDWLKTTRDLASLLGPPLCCEPKPATATVAAVVVDGNVLNPSKSDDHPATPPPEKVERKGTTKTTRVRKRPAGNVAGYTKRTDKKPA